MSKCADSMCQAQTQEDKHCCENHNPEPREPEARDLAAEHLDSIPHTDCRKTALAYSAELRAERDKAIKLRDEYLETGQRIQGDFERARAAYEASERSLLQAREAFKLIGKACDCSPTQMETAILYIAKIAGSAESKLASTSAPEGDLSK